MTRDIFVALTYTEDFSNLIKWIQNHKYTLIEIQNNRYEQSIKFKVNDEWNIKIEVDQRCSIPKKVCHGYPDLETLLCYLPQEINWCNNEPYDFGPYSW